MHSPQNIISEIIFALLLAAYVTGSFCRFLKQLWFMLFSINVFGWEYVHLFSCSCTLKLLNDSWVLILQHIFHLYIWMLHCASCYKTVHFHLYVSSLHCCFFYILSKHFRSFTCWFWICWHGLSTDCHMNSVVPIFKTIKPALFPVQIAFYDILQIFLLVPLILGWWQGNQHISAP